MWLLLGEKKKMGKTSHHIFYEPKMTSPNCLFTPPTVIPPPKKTLFIYCTMYIYWQMLTLNLVHFFFPKQDLNVNQATSIHFLLQSAIWVIVAALLQWSSFYKQWKAQTSIDDRVCTEFMRSFCCLHHGCQLSTRSGEISSAAKKHPTPCDLKRHWCAYDPPEPTELKPLCSSSAITDMCLKSAGWWLNVSTNRYVSCRCVP